MFRFIASTLLIAAMALPATSQAAPLTLIGEFCYTGLACVTEVATLWRNGQYEAQSFSGTYIASPNWRRIRGTDPSLDLVFIGVRQGSCFQGTFSSVAGSGTWTACLATP